MSATPFASATEAWLWASAALRARREGAAGSRWSAERPCSPDDIVKCLDRLYRRRRIDLEDAKLLRVWGERGRAPYASDWREAHLRQRWDRLMRALEGPLVERGIVVVIPAPRPQTEGQVDAQGVVGAD